MVRYFRKVLQGGQELKHGATGWPDTLGGCFKEARYLSNELHGGLLLKNVLQGGQVT